jgi:hypothetical protein
MTIYYYDENDDIEAALAFCTEMPAMGILPHIVGIHRKWITNHQRMRTDSWLGKRF